MIASVSATVTHESLEGPGRRAPARLPGPGPGGGGDSESVTQCRVVARADSRTRDTDSPPALGLEIGASVVTKTAAASGTVNPASQ